MACVGSWWTRNLARGDEVAERLPRAVMTGSSKSPVLRIPLSVLGSDPINQSGSGEGPGHSQDDRPSHQAIFGSSGLDWSNLVTSRAVFHPCIRPAPMDYSGLLGEG